MKRYLLFLGIGVLASTGLLAQNDPASRGESAADSGASKPEVFSMVEEMPEFPGGEEAMLQYIADNLKYPGRARRQKVEGRVVIRFVIDEEGNVTNVEAVKSLHPDCDKAALKVVKNMPRWKPGRQKGKPVRVFYMLPIRFQLS